MSILRHLLSHWRIRRSGRFDPEYYRKQVANGNGSCRAPLWHYVTRGWQEGLNPNAFFDTQWYIEAYPDVKRSANRLHPFVHYLDHGFGEARQCSPSGITYEEWILRAERYDPAEVRRHLAGLSYRPLISVIVPVFRPDLALLQACVDSVRRQHYDNWELCLSDDASGDEELEAYLRELERGEPRVRIVLNNSNGNISMNSNRALALGSGDYILLLDQDDLLADFALYEVVLRLNENLDTQILYSDEDKIDETGKRVNPHFKPDWNLDLLLSTNYVSHLGVYRRSLIEAVGGFREGYEGAQDYDLVLRCSKLVDEGEIEHIPRILYHWRATSGSTAASPDDKPYSWEAGKRALADYAYSRGLGASVEKGPFANTFRLRWRLPEPEPMVSLIIPTRDGGKVLRKCIASILDRTDYGHYEIVLMDNQSASAETLRYLARVGRHPRVRIVRHDQPFNFSRIINHGVSLARGELVALVNDDIEVIGSGWLREMVALAMREDVGCVGARLYYPDDTVQHGGIILGINGVASHAHKHFPRTAKGYFGRLVLTQQMAAVTAACLVVRRAVFDQVNGFDEQNLAIAFNDVDFCLRVGELGYRNVWTPWAELYHHESVSRGYEDTPEKLARFEGEIQYMKMRWESELNLDPAYNPNLSRYREDFSLAIPANG